jgi:uncharacterized protein (DUF1697 family)
VSRHIVLLRGINLGATNRVPMPALRDALAAEGFTGPGGGAVTTYLQSGNVALESSMAAAKVAGAVEALVADRFGVSSPALARSATALRALIDENPFPGRAEENPKRYQVSFLSNTISDEGRALVAERSELGETVAVATSGREVYAWHPDGVHTSRLATLLCDKKLGVTAVTARNWTTVCKCLELLEA